MTDKKLQKRIESLESYLGIIYSLDSDNYGEHNARDYGLINKMHKLLDNKKNN